ncbi:MAG: methyltransferase domain-containing protein [Myxococcales bacterium]|nr:methyltransferase domain-containing protein [Myxococcales bacterium]
MGDVFSSVVSGAREQLSAAAATAAHQLGVWDALRASRGGVLAAAKLAARLGLSPGKLCALLDVLALDGLLVRSGPSFAPCFAIALAPPPPVAPADAEWGRLAEVIRTGRPLDPLTDDAALRRFHHHLVTAGAAAAHELAGRLKAELTDGELLDAGGGAGVYTAALLDAAPTARATLADRPEVVALAAERLSRHLAGGRVRFAEGDLFEIALPSQIRVALLANLLHLHPPEACACLVARLAATLAPGGLLVIKDLRIEPDRGGPPSGVLFSLNMALYTVAGEVHDRHRIGAWLLAAGLHEVTFEALAAAPDAIVATARKPFI